MITFFGVVRSDDTLVSSSGTTADGAAIYTRPAGAGFSLVIEGRPGPNGAPVDRSAYQRDLTSFPDLQIQVSRPLGDGSAAVCDRSGPTVGGVPAVDPPSFAPSQRNIDAINDFACRFLDGAGLPGGRSANDACVLFSSGNFRFVNRDSRVQFCGFIGRPVEFPPGDTLITARLRAEDGSVGPRAQVVIHIGP